MNVFSNFQIKVYLKYRLQSPDAFSAKDSSTDKEDIGSKAQESGASAKKETNLSESASASKKKSPKKSKKNASQSRNSANASEQKSASDEKNSPTKESTDSEVLSSAAPDPNELLFKTPSFTDPSFNLVQNGQVRPPIESLKHREAFNNSTTSTSALNNPRGKLPKVSRHLIGGELKPIPDFKGPSKKRENSTFTNFPESSKNDSLTKSLNTKQKIEEANHQGTNKFSTPPRNSTNSQNAGDNKPMMNSKMKKGGYGNANEYYQSIYQNAQQHAQMNMAQQNNSSFATPDKNKNGTTPNSAGHGNRATQLFPQVTPVKGDGSQIASMNSTPNPKNNSESSTSPYESTPGVTFANGVAYEDPQAGNSLNARNRGNGFRCTVAQRRAQAAREREAKEQRMKSDALNSSMDSSIFKLIRFFFDLDQP